MMLPLTGGSPKLWSVSLVVYQTLLIAGYGYAHRLTGGSRRLPQVAIHIGLVLVCFSFLPVRAPTELNLDSSPLGPYALVPAFACSVALPIFTLSASTPLLHSWLIRSEARVQHESYRLFAASNAGAIGALVVYPFMLEPTIGVSEQATVWRSAFVIFAILLAGCAGNLLLARSHSTSPKRADRRHAAGRVSFPGGLVLRWILFASLPSAMLVTVTERVSSLTVAGSFSWILPLGLYLISLVYAFGRSFDRVGGFWKVCVGLTAVAYVVGLFVLPAAFRTTSIESAFLLGTFFMVCLSLHAKLSHSRPGINEQLTGFYLTQAAGGALGALFATALAPHLFLFGNELSCLLAISVWASIFLKDPNPMNRRAAFVSASVPLLLIFAFAYLPHHSGPRYVAAKRSFFGIHRVLDETDERRWLYHQQTRHGGQMLRGASHLVPQDYVSPQSGAGLVLQGAAPGWRIGVAGLGSGSLACYRQSGQDWTFFEIDPAVIQIARDSGVFTYLSECAPEASIEVGDARLSIADEVDGSFDVLILDAFLGGSVPVHLLTTEAFGIYLEKLSAEGILLVHVSSQHMDLKSVVARAADTTDRTAYIRHYDPRNDPNAEPMAKASSWMLIGKDQIPNELLSGWEIAEPSRDIPAWTDDYSNILAASLF